MAAAGTRLESDSDGTVVGVGVDAAGLAVVGGAEVVVVADEGADPAGFAVVGGVVVEGVVVAVVVDAGGAVVVEAAGGVVVGGVVVGGVVVVGAADCAAAADTAVGALPATVSEVAHALPGAQLPPSGNAPVVSLAPPGALEPTVTWNDVVACAFEAPGAPNGGTAHESVFAWVSSVKPL